MYVDTNIIYIYIYKYHVYINTYTHLMVAILTNPLKKKHGKGQRGAQVMMLVSTSIGVLLRRRSGEVAYSSKWWGKTMEIYEDIYETHMKQPQICGKILPEFHSTVYQLISLLFFWGNGRLPFFRCIRSEILWSFSIHSQGLLYEQRRINTFSKVATICVAERTFDHQKKSAQLSSNRSSKTYNPFMHSFQTNLQLGLHVNSQADTDGG